MYDSREDSRPQTSLPRDLHSLGLEPRLPLVWPWPDVGSVVIVLEAIQQPWLLQITRPLPRRMHRMCRNTDHKSMVPWDGTEHPVPTSVTTTYTSAPQMPARPRVLQGFRSYKG